MNIKIIDELSFFPIVALVITNNCRMNCNFCCEKTNQKIGDPSKSRIIELIDILSKAGVKRICYSGGEPLLSKDLESYLKLSSSYGIENILTTSDGLLLKNIEFPVSTLKTIRISVHGLETEHEDISRVPGSFKNIEQAITSLNNKYPVSITCVLTPSLKGKEIEFVKWCIKNNVYALYFNNLLKAGSGKDYIDKVGRYTPEEFNNLIIMLKKKFSDKISIIGHPFELDAQCVIVYDSGDVYITPCNTSPDYKKKIGNLFKETPRQVFENLKDDSALWNDYVLRLQASTIWKSKEQLTKEMQNGD